MNLRKEFPSPTERHVRNELVANKSDWEYEKSSRVLQLAVKDLSDTWIRFFKKSQESSGKPKIKRRKEPKQGFKTDSARIKNGRLLLEKPRDIQDLGYPMRIMKNDQQDMNSTKKTNWKS